MPTKLIPPSDDEIRALAHKFWEDEGRPEGQSESHWQRAYLALAKPTSPAAKSVPTKAPAVKKSSKPKSV